MRRPHSFYSLWTVFLSILVLTVSLQKFVAVKGYFEIDRMFGFAAIYGFFSCLAMIFVAKLLGRFIKRDEKYYQLRGKN